MSKTLETSNSHKKEVCPLDSKNQRSEKLKMNECRHCKKKKDHLPCYDPVDREWICSECYYELQTIYGEIIINEAKIKNKKEAEKKRKKLASDWFNLISDLMNSKDNNLKPFHQTLNCYNEYTLSIMFSNVDGDDFKISKNKYNTVYGELLSTNEMEKYKDLYPIYYSDALIASFNLRITAGAYCRFTKECSSRYKSESNKFFCIRCLIKCIKNDVKGFFNNRIIDIENKKYLAKLKADEEAERKRLADEAEAKRKADEEAERKRLADEAEAKRKAEPCESSNGDDTFQDLLSKIEEKLSFLNLKVGNETRKSFIKCITSENYFRYKHELDNLRTMLIPLYQKVETDEEDKMYEKYETHITSLQRQLKKKSKNFNLLKKRNYFFKNLSDTEKKIIVIYDNKQYNPTYARLITDMDVYCSCCKRRINNTISSQHQQKTNVYICSDCYRYYRE